MNDLVNMWACGFTADGARCVGKITSVCPGIYVEIEFFGALMKLINIEGVYHEKKNGSLTWPSVTDTANCKLLTPETIQFWLRRGADTKVYLTEHEISASRLLDPMSEEGLRRLMKPAPILRADVYSQFHEPICEMDFEYFCETGEIPPDNEGHRAPKPVIAQMTERKKKQFDEWHLARAYLHRTPSCNTVLVGGAPYSTFYSFDNSLLRVTDKNPQRELKFTVKLHPVSVPNSPVLNFTLGPPPSPICCLDEAEDLLSISGVVEEEERVDLSKVLGRLTTAEIQQGLEEHHHRMKRIHRHYYGSVGTMNDEDASALRVSEDWCMAAYLELRLRR